MNKPGNEIYSIMVEWSLALNFMRYKVVISGIPVTEFISHCLSNKTQTTEF